MPAHQMSYQAYLSDACDNKGSGFNLEIFDRRTPIYFQLAHCEWEKSLCPLFFCCGDKRQIGCHKRLLAQFYLDGYLTVPLLTVQ